MNHPTITCKNCGNHFHGKFCNNCGEKVFDQKAKSMVNIAEEVFHFMTHFDGTFFTTLKTFFSRPGKMSLDYANGIRKQYFKPVSFFLLLVVAYLLFPRFEGLNMRYWTYVSPDYDFSWYAVPVAKLKMSAHRLTEAKLAAAYDAHSAGFAKSCLFLLIPMSAFVLSLIFYTSRKYFFDHFMLATEIMSFYIFTQFLFLPFLSVIVVKTAPAYGYLFSDGSWLWHVVFVAFGLFITAAFRNFYKQPIWLSTLKALLFLFVFGAVIRYVYNVILYLLVMLFV